jgi:D-alanine-D-alanine ligase
MGASKFGLLPLQVVLVTESRQRESPILSRHARDLDMTTPRQAQSIRSLLQEVVEDVVVFTDLRQFARDAEQNRNCIVWPHWNGARNRNRTAQVAMICEIYGLRYVGPDPYARLIANDKTLTKTFLRQSGLTTPESVFIGSDSQTALIETLNPPLIVKPNMEGSSIGIDRHSVVATRESAATLARERLQEFDDGIIVEEFVSGPEVFVALAFDKLGGYRCGCSERIVKGEPTFLYNDVYDYELKFSGTRELTLRSATFLTDALLEKMVQLTKTLKTIDLIRVDGRLHAGEFSVIEVTPDPLMTPGSEFLGSLARSGHKPSVVIREIIERVAATPPNRLSNNSETLV